MSSTPIADHALLSDCHSAGLVTRDGSVDWLCFPRFDSPSVFARLLDEAAGYWSLRPVADFETTRRYSDKTMVLETTFTTATGSVTLVDALAMGANERGHDIGGEAPSLLIRQIEGMAGQVEIEVEYVPRTDYGLIHPLGLSAVCADFSGTPSCFLQAWVSVSPPSSRTSTRASRAWWALTARWCSTSSTSPVGRPLLCFC